MWHNKTPKQKSFFWKWDTKFLVHFRPKGGFLFDFFWVCKTKLWFKDFFRPCLGWGLGSLSLLEIFWSKSFPHKEVPGIFFNYILHIWFFFFFLKTEKRQSKGNIFLAMEKSKKKKKIYLFIYFGVRARGGQSWNSRIKIIVIIKFGGRGGGKEIFFINNFVKEGGREEGGRKKSNEYISVSYYP